VLRDIRRTFPVDDAVLYTEGESILADQRFGELRAKLGVDLRVGARRLRRLQDQRQEERGEDSEDHIRLVLGTPDPSHFKKSKRV
jgi:hypothetical protein